MLIRLFTPRIPSASVQPRYLEKIMKFINRNAYIIVAIKGALLPLPL